MPAVEYNIGRKCDGEATGGTARLWRSKLRTAMMRSAPARAKALGASDWQLACGRMRATATERTLPALLTTANSRIALSPTAASLGSCGWNFTTAPVLRCDSRTSQSVKASQSSAKRTLSSVNTNSGARSGQGGCGAHLSAANTAPMSPTFAVML
jgi:hypothetical protein